MTIESRTFQLRYVGARFNGARLPTNVLPDLGAFRDLLVAYAKDRWRTQHADRKRLPRGFDQSISFDLIQIEEGSAMPKLDWSRIQAQAALPGFEDEISEIVENSFLDVVKLFGDAEEQKFPEALSSEHIRALNKFGSGLKDNEQIEFVGKYNKSGNVIYLNNHVRKELITHVRETYQQRYEGVGLLRGLHLDGQVSVDTTEYGEIRFNIDSERARELKDFLECAVQYDLIIELDHQDNYRGVIEVHDLEVIDPNIANYITASIERINYISTLEPGWFDGEGLKISDLAIKNAKSFINRRRWISEEMLIFPTPEGGINFEFDSGAWDYTVEVCNDGSVIFYGLEVNGDGSMDPVTLPDLDEEFMDVFDSKVNS